MNSALPKVLQPLAGRPLLGHVLTAARALEPAAVHVVYGHGGEQVQAALAADLAIVAPRSSWVLQAEQKGTGHAMQQALPALHDDQIVLVLYGDVPLVQPETLRALVALAGPKSLGLLTVELPDPTGYGRIVRDARGKVLRIVEQKDANARERKIREGNTGIMAVPVKRLRAWLSKLRNANAQGEYYLTDIIAMAVKDKVAPLAAPTVAEVLGINDKVQLAEAECALQHSRARALMAAGATLADTVRVDVRGEVVVGRDVFIDINVVFEGRVVLGDGVIVGPGCVLRDCELAAGVRLNAYCVIEGATVGAGSTITKDVPAGTLVVARGKPVAIAGWKRPSKSGGRRVAKP